MNRMKTTLAALLFFCAPLAHALAPVVTEVVWNEKTVAFSTSGVTAFTFDVGGFGAAGFAINGGTQTLNGVDGTVYGSTAPIVLNSSTTAAAQNVVAFNYVSYSTRPCSLQIAQTIKTPAPLGTRSLNGNSTSTTGFNSPFPSAFNFTAPVISTSSVISIPASVLWTDTFRAKVTNPIFYFTGLNSGATYYFSVDYGVPAQQ